MSKVKKHTENNKISRTAVKRGGNCPQIPAFSFAYLTANNIFNLNYFTDTNDKKAAIENIFERLLEICQNDWKYWHALPREQGVEMISVGGINLTPSKKRLMPDEKVIIFRMKGYAGKSARILGIREEGCPILYIIGFDFNFSAYNHG